MIKLAKNVIIIQVQGKAALDVSLMTKRKNINVWSVIILKMRDMVI